MQKLKLALPLLLPEIDARDGCVRHLTERLAGVRGVEQAHIVRDNGTAQLCLHFDPNLVPLARLERLAQEAGAAVTQRYRHEQLAFAGLDAADAASTLEDALAELPGMLHVAVNYAAGLLFVAYDSQQLERTAIEATVRSLGARLVGPMRSPQGVVTGETSAADAGATLQTGALTQAESGEADAHDAREHEAHDHGSAPTFLPHWMQERWTLILVALAGLFLVAGWAGERFLGLPAEIALIFFILSYIAGGYDVATHAVPGLLRGKFDTDVLMLAAALGAAILGEWAEGAFLLFLFSLGHAGEHYALDRARNAVNALGELMPKTARVRRGGELTEVPVDALQVGEVVVVPPGDRLPVDGEVAQGSSAVDQSPITGESVPVEKQPGDGVFAGSINQTAALEVRVTALARDNTLSRVLKLVQEAQSQQSPTQQFTERFTRWFVPAVLIVVLGVIVLPPLVGWMGWTASFYRAMLLLVAASPCALAIGTPAAVLAGIAQAARHGVLIKGGVHLENLGRLQVMAFDKTGTLTEGRFAVTDVVPADGVTPEQLLAVAAAVEQQSSHPLAQAVVQAAQERKLALPSAEGLENIPGKGVRSQVDGQPVLIGSPRLFEESDGHRPDEAVAAAVAQLTGAGKSIMVVSQNGAYLGVLGLADQPRPQVRQTLQRLLDLGVKRLVMLTGDHQAVAERIAADLGVTDVRAGLLPEDKLTAIRGLEAEHGAIAMAGDGVNDAPALASATVGIAMGGAGTAVALETADVALMGDDLGRLPFAVGLSRASRAIIRQNLAISLGVIALLIVTSVLGWVQLSGAVVLHEGSTIVVVLNALRLLAYTAK
ncbi:MAG: cadmium-translocating P-type ATPase [Chloroflexi bacterium]|nr:MAG: cadmium-translocating P-type ATPase [Chloroflexota bacterium]